MMTHRIPALLLSFLLLPAFFSMTLSAQDQPAKGDFFARKNIRAVRVQQAPKIDGILEDACWQGLPVASDFVEYAPNNGKPSEFTTEIRFAYNDEALYVAAMMYDPAPDSIDHQLGQRDQLEELNTDRMSVDILPYNDGLNMYEFKVSPAGVLSDVKYTAIGQDPAWEAVWECGTKINDKGWVAEFRIPFSSLRFPQVDEQVWGINIWRNVNRLNHWSTWCYVDNKSENIFKYYGELHGMTGISVPLRLSFSPFIASYADKQPEDKNPSYLFKGGMDLKYGLSESYTLDMILIPDFGQVQSDEEVLNLTPFEVKYDENRQFFTEGTELFNKCGIFYSRRVGSQPRDYLRPYYSLKEGEQVSKNPEETRLINATKVSGRNAKGLGIGLFNAMTSNSWAEISDSTGEQKRKFLTQPFTNYNVLVFDQNLPHNSYLTLINTNMSIPDGDYLANVTGMETSLYNKANSFQMIGQACLSQQFAAGSNPVRGHRLMLNGARPRGTLRYSFFRDQTDNHYDPNDMGYLSHRNIAYNEVKLSHFITQPVGKIINSETSLPVDYQTTFEKSLFQDFYAGISNYTTFTSYWSTYFMIESHPLGVHDFYEPRWEGWYYEIPAYTQMSCKINSDSRKRLMGVWSVDLINSPGNKLFTYALSLGARFRFSDRLSLEAQSKFQKENNNTGWADVLLTDPLAEPEIIFGRRDVTTIENVIYAQYIFSPVSAMTLKTRHYWSKAAYLSFHRLGDDGKLYPVDYSTNDMNFNVLTIDLAYRWHFAPGSELSLVWKNSIHVSNGAPEPDYWTSFSHTIREPQANSLSVKAIYYIDYLKVRSKLIRK